MERLKLSSAIMLFSGVGYLLSGLLALYACWAVMFVFILWKSKYLERFYLPWNLFTLFYTLFIVLGFFIYSLVSHNKDIGFMTVYMGSLLLLMKRKHINLGVLDHKMLTSVYSDILMLILVALGLISVILLYWRIGGIPFFMELSPDQRVLVHRGNGFLLQFIRIGIYTSLLYWIRESKIMYLVLFLSLNLALLGTGFRGEFTQYILLAILLHYFKHNRALKQRRILLIGLAGLIVLSLLEYLRSEISEDMLLFVVLNLSAILSVGVYNFDFIIHRWSDFQYGKTYFYNFKMFIPGPDKDFTVWLTEEVGMNFKAGITPTILGDFYINWGPWSFIFIYLFLFFLKRCNSLLIRSTSPASVLLYINIGLLLARSCTGGISNQFIQIFISSAVLLMFKLLELNNESTTYT
jgi:oligosaccharide repeat unit polymerase